MDLQALNQLTLLKKFEALLNTVVAEDRRA